MTNHKFIFENNTGIELTEADMEFVSKYYIIQKMSEKIQHMYRDWLPDETTYAATFAFDYYGLYTEDDAINLAIEKFGPQFETRIIQEKVKSQHPEYDQQIIEKIVDYTLAFMNDYHYHREKALDGALFAVEMELERDREE